MSTVLVCVGGEMEGTRDNNPLNSVRCEEAKSTYDLRRERWLSESYGMWHPHLMPREFARDYTRAMLRVITLSISSNRKSCEAAPTAAAERVNCGMGISRSAIATISSRQARQNGAFSHSIHFCIENFPIHFCIENFPTHFCIEIGRAPMPCTRWLTFAGWPRSKHHNLRVEVSLSRISS